jgi:branched-chain amino acid transport system substrate-binding protein
VGLGSTPYLGGDGISDAEFLKEAGSMAENSYFSIAAPDVEKLPSAVAFTAAYKARFKSAPGSYSANTYTAAAIEIAAIEKAIKENGGKMPTRAAVLKNIASTHDFDSPIGKVGFDANGDTTAPILTFKKINASGAAVTVDQIVLK